MKTKIRDWCTRAWSTILSLPGEAGPDTRTRWDEYSKHNAAVFTLFGPYDSGKSSILKRLLVDAGQPIPDWLTISGRRETFERREVTLMGAILRDTPGIAGGNDLHEMAARDSLLLADVIVLVLPPQLVTSERETLLGVLNGTYFNCPPHVAHAPHGLIVALSRMDEAGATPSDDPSGYECAVTRKRQELGSLLESASVGEDLLTVQAVAADPFGLVGNTQPAGREAYDANRNWDGMDGLARTIADLAGRVPELRVHSEARFLGAELGALAASLGQMESERRTAAEAASNEAASHAQSRQRLKAILAAARADLDRRIEEEGSAAARRSATGVDQLRDVVFARLDTAIEQWAREHDSVLDALARETDTEMNVRQQRPAWKKMSEVMAKEASKSCGDVDPSPGTADRKILGKMERLAKALHKGFREAQPLVLGMPLEKAREEIQRLQKAGSFQEYMTQRNRSTFRLRDPAHAAQVRRAILIDGGFEVAVPALFELAGLLSDIVDRSTAAQQRVQRRKEVRQIIEDASKRCAERAWHLWQEDMPAALEARLTEAQSRAASVADALRAERGSVEDSLAAVRSRLKELGAL